MPVVVAGESWRLTASQVATLVHARQLSATEVARDALDHLEVTNPAINAVVEYRPDEVLARAAAVDAAIDRGDTPGLLAGVTVTIKINADQAGFATTNGIRLQKDLIARSNSPVVDNLLKAGAVLLGRSNAPSFSYRWFTDNLLHGHTLNPRNALLTPGGSSGGAAAAVAAGIGHIGHGTDIAGSIRYPAYACGVHGLRPTVGRVPMFNASNPNRPFGVQIAAVAGPIARSVADLRLGLLAMSAPDPRDGWQVPAPFDWPSMPRRAAVCLRPDGLDTCPEIVDALIDAAERLRDAGWMVDEVDALPPLKDACPDQIRLWMGEGYEQQVARALEEGDPAAVAALEGQREIAAGLSADDFSAVMMRRATLCRLWNVYLQERYPVVLMPASAELPFEADLDMRSPEAHARVWGAQMPMIAIPFVGLPALFITTGQTPDGTPVGVQIVAGRYREDLCLAAAEDIEARCLPVMPA